MGTGRRCGLHSHGAMHRLGCRPGAKFVSGFSEGGKIPRFFCAQATSRASWKLLNAMHTAQADQGLALTSEATLPSFAIWHRLKVSFPPQPWFVHPPPDARYLNDMLNGDWPPASDTGFADGTAGRDDALTDEFNAMGPTYNWHSFWPGQIMDAWLNPGPGDKDLPWILREHEGHVYMPNLALHPVKASLLH